MNGHDLTDPENVRPNGKGCAVCHRENQKARYHEDPERHRAASSEYQKRNRPERTAYHRRWRGENYERELQRSKEAKRLRYLPTASESRAYATVLRRDPCSYCGGSTDGADHIVPLSAGGDNDWSNLTAACGSCNASKSTMPLLLFLARR